MKRIILLILPLLFLAAKDKPILDDENELAQYNHQEDKEDIKQNIYLDKMQKIFFYKNRTGDENINFIKFDKKKTYRIRTREGMSSTIVLENDNIKRVIATDKESFDFVEVDKNIITIVPKIIGIDTNLTLVGESGFVYNFYVFSTKTTNSLNPTLITYIDNPQIKEKNIRNSSFRLPKGRKIEEYMIIGDETNKLYIDRLKIQNRIYKQIAKPSVRSKSGTFYVESRESEKIKALEIFNDNQFTYFRFNRDLASSRFPAVFEIIDGKKAQVDFSIVGDYLVAKTIADEWVFVEGKKEVFVRVKK